MSISFSELKSGDRIKLLIGKETRNVTVITDTLYGHICILDEKISNEYGLSHNDVWSNETYKRVALSLGFIEQQHQNVSWYADTGYCLILEFLNKNKSIDGHSCKKCNNFCQFSEPNQSDGSFVCYSCRK